MAIGIRCLITDDPHEAFKYAQQLDQLNRERREIESGMTVEALALLDAAPPDDSWTITLFRPDWHPGIVGLLASRLKDRWHRPAIVFARNSEAGREDEIRGSGRSIEGFHLRDALDLVSKREPGLLGRFGGHAMAAGLTLREADLPRFSRAIEAVAREGLDEARLLRIVETDGALGNEPVTLALAEALRAGVWGQGFPAPSFDEQFAVAGQRWFGGKHLRLRIVREADPRASFEAVAFNQDAELPERIHAVYRVDVSEYQGLRTLQLVIEHWEPAR
jgi:single-stranded-DNA-specific exonuclease